MENNFDKQIKNLLEGSSPDAAGFDLDRRAVWERIESKQKTKVLPFKRWISYAAAVIIGILLCLPFLFRSEKEIIKTVTITKTIPSTQTITDTVLVVQNPTPDNHKPRMHVSGNKKDHTDKSDAAPILQPKQESNNLNNITDNLPAIAKTEMPKAKVQVLHITDMENENVYPQARAKESYALFNKINFPARMEDKSETVSMIVSNQFFNSKN